MCCQVEVSATDLSLVQGSPTDSGASLCAIKKPRMRRAYSPLLGCENTKPQWVVAPVGNVVLNKPFNPSMCTLYPRLTPRMSPSCVHSTECILGYRFAQHNDVSVNDGPHILRWSHKIIFTIVLQLPTVFSTVTCCTSL